MRGRGFVIGRFCSCESFVFDGKNIYNSAESKIEKKVNHSRIRFRLFYFQNESL